MRYVAKIHILDVMDSVVVSGYVFDADDYSNPDHDTVEFAFSVNGVGVSDPYAWLLNSLYRALVKEQSPGSLRDAGALVDGGPHTISGLGQDRQERVG
jgi:hypothetical protein